MFLDGFDWDHGNIAKVQKHGLSVDDIERFFQSPLFVAPDPRHSQAEDRFLAIGRGPDKRPVIIAYTMRMRLGLWLVRPISARFMHDKEVKVYEEAFAKNEK